MLAALGSWLLARRAGGQWLVRIEDVDPPREVPGAAALQLQTLAACGLVPDEPPQYQSRRHRLYRQALDRLLDQGLAFACSCSRSELAAQGGIHARCVSSRPRPQPAWRLQVAPATRVGFDDLLQGHHEQDVAAEVGDFVLLRADGCWAYQLAVVVDDADQGITDVVRGADLLDSTPRQILLQRALGLPTPRYLHLPLLLDEHGHKLSKSSAAMPVDAGQPLLALQNAWRALGQDLAPIQRAQTPQALLECALLHFDETRLPARLHFPGTTSTTASRDS
jgi:glutamyl-Q tRNA(Asp) synthetase